MFNRSLLAPPFSPLGWLRHWYGTRMTWPWHGLNCWFIEAYTMRLVLHRFRTVHKLCIRDHEDDILYTVIYEPIFDHQGHKHSMISLIKLYLRCFCLSGFGKTKPAYNVHNIHSPFWMDHYVQDTRYSLNILWTETLLKDLKGTVTRCVILCSSHKH